MLSHSPHTSCEKRNYEKSFSPTFEMSAVNYITSFFFLCIFTDSSSEFIRVLIPRPTPTHRIIFPHYHFVYYRSPRRTTNSALWQRGHKQLGNSATCLSLGLDATIAGLLVAMPMWARRQETCHSTETLTKNDCASSKSV